MPVSAVPHASSTHTHTHASTSNWAWALRMGKGNQGLRRPGNDTLPSEIRDPSRTSRTTQNKGERPWARVLGVRQALPGTRMCLWVLGEVCITAGGSRAQGWWGLLRKTIHMVL